MEHGDLQDLENQVRMFCDRCLEIKQLLQEKLNSGDFAVTEGSQNHY